MADPGRPSFDDKLAYFQAVTGLQDTDLCSEILAAHHWDLELAISSLTTSTSTADPGRTPLHVDAGTTSANGSELVVQEQPPAAPGIAWKFVMLPFYVISGGLGLVSRAVGVGVWVAGGIISNSLGIFGLIRQRNDASGSAPLVPPSSPASAEATEFVAAFEREFGGGRVNFMPQGFMEALQRSRREFKLLFVYLHSQDHSDTHEFCEECLCADDVVEFINENFVSWGGSIKMSEGFRMSNSLSASRYPFCAVVMAASNQRIAVLQQIEGPKTPQEMLQILLRVLEESTPVLVAARVEAEERRNNMRLIQEQDAAFRASLDVDRAREQTRKEEQERLEREAAEAEQKRKEDEEAQERAAQEASEKEAARARRQQEKAMLLGPEPEKGPDVTQVLVRFPAGERRGRRFYSSSTVKSLYDFVDSLDCLLVENYRLVSNFPRVSYGPEKNSLSLREAGLHPQASLFVEVDT